MVSYFVPRGRFLIRAGHLRQAHQKHQPNQPPHHQGKWPLFFNFRQTFSTKPATKSDTFVRSDELRQSIVSKLSCKAPLQELQDRRRSVWAKWAGFLLRWAPVGFCVFGAFEWQLHKKKCTRENIPRTASEFQSKIYCSLPLRLISRCWGWLAACYIPTSIRPFVYGCYSKAFNVIIEEAAYPDFKYYNSLAEFFTRPLRDGARPINQSVSLVSPADGKVLHFGSATNSLIEQVKGVNYSIQNFLGPPSWDEATLPSADMDYEKAIKYKHDDSTALYQVVIYLAPGDYHRFHSAASWQPKLRRHFSGELLSVSPKVATWLPGLFCLNERAVYLGKWQYGFFSYTAVGATNVGSVQIYMDDQLKTNRWVGLNVGAHKRRTEYDELTLAESTVLEKGDLIGQFNMGSTIVLLFEAPKNFQFNINAGQKIRVGEALGHVAGT